MVNDAYGNRPFSVSASAVSGLAFAPNVPGVNPFGANALGATYRQGKLVLSEDTSLLSLGGYDAPAGWDWAGGKREPAYATLNWLGELKVDMSCKVPRTAPSTVSQEHSSLARNLCCRFNCRLLHLRPPALPQRFLQINDPIYCNGFNHQVRTLHFYYLSGCGQATRVNRHCFTHAFPLSEFFPTSHTFASRSLHTRTPPWRAALGSCPPARSLPLPLTESGHSSPTVQHSRRPRASTRAMTSSPCASTAASCSGSVPSAAPYPPTVSACAACHCHPGRYESDAVRPRRQALCLPHLPSNRVSAPRLRLSFFYRRRQRRVCQRLCSLQGVHHRRLHRRVALPRAPVHVRRLRLLRRL